MKENVEKRMAAMRWDETFSETTKGRILAILRRGASTVDQLAARLGLTDNAVRAHIGALQRDGVVHQRGVLPTGGKPAYLYEVTSDAERLFTKAYIPVLTELVTVLEARLGSEKVDGLFGEVGRRLAASRAPSSGSLVERAEIAAAFLGELGGIVDVEQSDGGVTLRGFSCPLADAVRSNPAVCRAVESLVSELMGVPAREQCKRGERPQCCFEIRVHRG